MLDNITVSAMPLEADIRLSQQAAMIYRVGTSNRLYQVQSCSDLR